MCVLRVGTRTSLAVRSDCSQFRSFGASDGARTHCIDRSTSPYHLPLRLRLLFVVPLSGCGDTGELCAASDCAVPRTAQH
jgi:hypothetical protein